MSDIRIGESNPKNVDGNRSRFVLVCGATGYVGGRLVQRLLNAGYRVRCLVRDPGKLADMPFCDHPALEVVTGDLQDQQSITKALDGIDIAYYLVHSMIAAGAEYAERDRQLAKNFADEISRSSCKRVIYLGGLGEIGPDLSRHLQSRREVEEILRGSTAKVTVFRAAMIIGSGSASFEMLRYLTHRLPIMLTPKWVATKTQPIAVRDVLRYLLECLEQPDTAGKTLDIGGPDVVSHREMFQVMADRLQLRARWVIPVPVLTPTLSSLWIGLVTPISPQIARPLAEGLKNETVCRNEEARALMPGTLFNVQEAVDAALGKIGNVETRWDSAGDMPTDPDWSGGTVFTDDRNVEVNVNAAQVFQTVCRIGGEHGYWSAQWLWWVRGMLDQFVGGPGLRRGRRHPEHIRYGEALDFWRVTRVAEGVLRLRAEMKLPGIGELEFRVEPTGENSSIVRQVARFRPLGLFGLIYWYSILPAHGLVFERMLQGLKLEAESART